MATADPSGGRRPVDPKRFRREARRAANAYVNDAIDRAACVRALHAAANAAGIDAERPRGSAERALRALVHGRGDIEPGTFPRHLEPLHADDVDLRLYADAVRDLLARLITEDPPARSDPSA